jgi:precorrin-6A synthase
MRRVFVIGIGAGDPEYVTVQAIRALNAADVLFVLEKADEQRELIELRHEICRRYIERDNPRVVTAPDPPRSRGDGSPGAYAAAIADWRRRRADVCEALITGLGEDEAGAFLVWGDPGLYDSTLGVLEDILARGRVEFAYEVIPGISAPAALAARHRVVLNRVGGAFAVTPGRRLPEAAGDAVVMLDAGQAFLDVDPDGVEIYWGAYLGTPDEILISGRLSEVAGEIARVRAEARERKGWMFDTYLLRRGGKDGA